MAAGAATVGSSPGGSMGMPTTREVLAAKAGRALTERRRAAVRKHFVIRLELHPAWAATGRDDRKLTQDGAGWKAVITDCSLNFGPGEAYAAMAKIRGCRGFWEA